MKTNKDVSSQLKKFCVQELCKIDELQHLTNPEGRYVWAYYSPSWFGPLFLLTAICTGLSSLMCWHSGPGPGGSHTTRRTGGTGTRRLRPPRPQPQLNRPRSPPASTLPPSPSEGGQPSPRVEAAMKLVSTKLFFRASIRTPTLTRASSQTCLSATGGGGSYHSPASHLLELEGLRFLLDCPIDLSALAVFSPLPLTSDAGGLIRAVPRYWSPAAAAAAKVGGVDAVLVSSATGMLGLPFLTRLPGFAHTKVQPLLLLLLSA